MDISVGLSIESTKKTVLTREEFIDLLKNRMKEKGYGQEGIAGHIKVSQSNVSDTLAGKGRWKTLSKIAAALGVKEVVDFPTQVDLSNIEELPDKTPTRKTEEPSPNSPK